MRLPFIGSDLLYRGFDRTFTATNKLHINVYMIQLNVVKCHCINAIGV